MTVMQNWETLLIPLKKNLYLEEIQENLKDLSEETSSLLSPKQTTKHKDVEFS